MKKEERTLTCKKPTTQIERQNKIFKVTLPLLKSISPLLDKICDFFCFKDLSRHVRLLNCEGPLESICIIMFEFRFFFTPSPGFFFRWGGSR